MANSKGIGGHQSQASRTVEWLTPPDTIERTGGWQSYGLDPCAPIEQPYPTALRTYTILDDGLSKEWPPEWRVFGNPPYGTGEIEPWLSRAADHGNGTWLIFARTETAAWVRSIWQRAHAVLLMFGRIHFHIGEGYSELKWVNGRPACGKTFLAGDRAPGNAGGPTALIAYGDDNADILRASGIAGQFIPLIWNRSVLGAAFRDVTWCELIVGVLTEAEGPVAVAAVWEAVRFHHKAQGRKFAREQVRKILQRVGERTARGQYRMAI